MDTHAAVGSIWSCTSFLDTGAEAFASDVGITRLVDTAIIVRRDSIGTSLNRSTISVCASVSHHFFI